MNTIQFIFDSIIGGGAIFVLTKVYHKFNKPTDAWGPIHVPDASGAYPWLYDEDYEKYVCPHCRGGTASGAMEKFCECEDYFIGHFHFVCAVCKFSTVMKTAAKIKD